MRFMAVLDWVILTFARGNYLFDLCILYFVCTPSWYELSISTGVISEETVCQKFTDDKPFDVN